MAGPFSPNVGQHEVVEPRGVQKWFAETLGVGERDPYSVIKLDPGLTPADRASVLRHEIGHAIDNRSMRAAPIYPESSGLYRSSPIGEGPEKNAFIKLYDRLNRERLVTEGHFAPHMMPQGHIGPGFFFYPSEQVGPELWAEAYRAYLTDPNWLKAFAPQVAAAIRRSVNDTPELSRIIQFNALPFALMGGAGAGALGALASHEGNA